MISKRAIALHMALALAVWALWFALGGGSALFDLMAAHWPITVTMVFGSFIAGATAEGGGAVAFPVFTKALGIAPEDARLFALAIQSVGMTAASLVILALRVKVDWRMLGWASLGGLPGLLIGATLVAPLMAPSLTRMIFTVMAASFAVALLALNRRDRAYRTELPKTGPAERLVLLTAGCLGGMLTALVGTGIDIVTFSVVVLLFRLSEKIATPTSVLLMAGNSVAGFALYGLALDAYRPEVIEWWLAAIPVVVIGAPLGAMLCSLLDRVVIARVLIGLIAIEVVSSLILVPMDALTAAVSLAALLLFGGLYAWMYRQRTYEPAAT